MTNRIQDTYQITDAPQTQAADIAFIREILVERGDELSLENARFVLAIGLRNRPDAWTLTLEELPKLWAETVTN